MNATARCVRSRVRTLEGAPAAVGALLCRLASSWLGIDFGGFLQGLSCRLDAFAAALDGVRIETPLAGVQRQIIACRHASQVTCAIDCGAVERCVVSRCAGCGVEVFIGFGVEQLSHEYIMTRGCDSLD